MRHSTRCAIAAFAATLSACGGSNNNSVPADKVFVDATVPGITPTTNFSFDLGTVVNNKYYVTDDASNLGDGLNGFAAMLTVGFDI